MKHKKLFPLVEKLYLNSDRKFAQWGWGAHVQVVSNFAEKLAKKYLADEDICVCAAFLHDIGDVKFDRGNESDKFSEEIARDFLKRVGFSNENIEKVINDVIDPHSCYPESKPSVLEGKILATVDALAHLSSNFYLHMLWINLPAKLDFNEWSSWLLKKIDRDFNDKIFFDDERESVRKNYEALKLMFLENKI